MSRNLHRRVLYLCAWAAVGFTLLTLFDIFAPWNFAGFAISAASTLILNATRS